MAVRNKQHIMLFLSLVYQLLGWWLFLYKGELTYAAGCFLAAILLGVYRIHLRNKEKP